jgi:hypothetical protein
MYFCLYFNRDKIFLLKLVKFYKFKYCIVMLYMLNEMQGLKIAALA